MRIAVFSSVLLLLSPDATVFCALQQRNLRLATSGAAVPSSCAAATCPFPSDCVERDGVVECVTADSCEDVECPNGGEIFIYQQVQCITEPCNRIPACIPNPCTSSTCADEPGTVCNVDKEGSTSCVQPNPCSSIACELGEECRLDPSTGDPTCEPIQDFPTCECTESQICVFETVQCLVAPCDIVAVCVEDLCADESCGEGTVCKVNEEGKAVCVDPCADVKCRGSDYCDFDAKGVNVFCRPAQDVCENVVCELPDQVCYPQAVACVRAPCYPIATCTDDSCRGVECGSGFTCSIDGEGNQVCLPASEPATNPCAVVRCGFGTVCKINKEGHATCVDPCTDLQCQDSDYCAYDSTGSEAICRSAQKVCEDFECEGAGQICYPQNVQCIKAPCPPIAACMDDPCTTALCESGFVCSVDGEGNQVCLPDLKPAIDDPEEGGKGTGNQNGNGNANGNGNGIGNVPNFFVCFSSSSTVEIQNQGTKMLKDVKLGDPVRVGKNAYEPIYSFGHFNVDARADFVEIKTDATTLQLTRDHMVFRASGTAVPAAMVKVDDELVDGNGGTIFVKSIKSTSSMGVIAPFTPSGKIVVDGVLASSFVAFEASSHLTVFGMKVSYQWMAHSFEFPHRLFCNYLTECLEETYDEDGVSTWVSTPRRGASWMMEQGFTLKNLLGLLMVCLFVVFNAIEYAVLHPVSACAGAYFIWKIRYRCGSKKA